MIRLLKIPLILILLIPLILSLFWFRNGNIMGAGESGLVFYNLKRQYEISKYTWADPGLGNGVGIGVIAIPIFWLFSRIETMGVTPQVIQAGFFVTIFYISGLSIYFLIKELSPTLDNKTRLLAVFFYWFNPISLVNVWNRFLYNYMLFWALIPLVSWTFIVGIRKKDFRFAVITSLLTLIFSFGLSSPVFVILLIGILSFYLLFYFFFSNKIKIFLVKYFLIFLISFFLFHFWWINQSFSFLLSSGYKSSVSQFFSTYGNLSGMHGLSNLLGRFIYTFRFMHGTFYINGPKWALLYVSPIFVISEFIISGLFIWAFIKQRREKNILMMGSLFFLTLFLIKGDQPPFGEFFRFAFVKIPLLQIFRNPFEKFGFILPLTSSILFASGLGMLSEYKGKLINLIKSVVILSIIFIWGFPFWTGVALTFNIGGNKLISYAINVPDYYKDADKWLKECGNNFRFISLPLDGEGISYNWNNSLYSGVESSSMLFEIPNISFNTSTPFYTDLVSKMTNYQLNESLFNFFPFTNIRYILLRKDIDYQERRMANPQTSENILSIWNLKGYLTKVYEKGEISIYEVGKHWFWPKIYSTRNILFTDSSDLANQTKYIDSFPQETAAFVDAKNINKNLDYSEIILGPEDISLQKVATPLPKDFTEKDLLGRLFHAKHLPDTLYYPLVILKEKLEELSQGNYDSWIIYKTGILGKRAVEIYKLKNKKAPERIILRAEGNYRKELELMKPRYLSLIDNEDPISKLVRDSLSYQWILLSRVGSSEADNLTSLLINWGIKTKFELPVSDKDYIVYSLDIPQEGNYEINFDQKGFSIKKVFVDGNITDLSQGKVLGFNKGKHEVALELDAISKDVISDSNIIELSNANLFSQKVDVPDIPTTYSVRFDYRFVEGDIFGIHFIQDIDKNESPVFYSGVGKEKNYHGWKHWDTEFTTTSGATQGKLEVVPVDKEVCRKFLFWKLSCIKQSNFRVELRNFEVKILQYPDIHLLSIKNSHFPATKTKIEWNKINPTQYRIKINKPQEGSEMLVFSELYNSLWQAEYNDGTKIPQDLHFLVNVYANGWIIDRSGEYEVNLEYTPQRLLDIGKTISGISIISGVFLVGLLSWRIRKH